MADSAKLMVEIAADATKLRSDLAKSRSQIEGFANGAGSLLRNIAIGAGAYLSINKFTNALLDASTALDNTKTESEKLGVSFGAFQKLAYQASQADTSVGSLGTGLKFLLKNVEEAVNGSTELQTAFNKVGTSAFVLKGQKPEEQFYAIARGFSQIKDANEAANLSMKIFGRSGLDVLPLLRSDLTASGKKFNDLGIQITDAQGNMNDAFDQSRKDVSAFYAAIGQGSVAELANSWTTVNEAIITYGKSLGGVRGISLDVASTTLKAVGAMVAGFDEVYKKVNLTAAGLQILHLGMASIYVEFKRFAAISKINEDIKAGRRKVPLPGEIEKEFANFGKDITDPIAARAQVNLAQASGQSDISKLLSDLQAGINKEQLRIVGESQKNLAKETNKAAEAVKGFGEIVGSDGRRVTIGNVPGTSTPTVGTGISNSGGVPNEIEKYRQGPNSFGNVQITVTASPELNVKIDERAAKQANIVLDKRTSDAATGVR